MGEIVDQSAPLLLEQFADRDLEPQLQSLIELIVAGLARRP